MRVRIPVFLLLGAAVAGSGCATADQWAEWRQHSSHFASGQHLFFSLRHQGKDPTPRVRQQDVQKANAESWWGDPVVVRPEQLFAS
jgi:hypothetical protein